MFSSFRVSTASFLLLFAVLFTPPSLQNAVFWVKQKSLFPWNQLFSNFNADYVIVFFSTQRRRAAEFREILEHVLWPSVRARKQWERCAGSRCAEVAEAYGEYVRAKHYIVVQLEWNPLRTRQSTNLGAQRRLCAPATSRDSVNSYAHYLIKPQRHIYVRAFMYIRKGRDIYMSRPSRPFVEDVTSYRGRRNGLSWKTWRLIVEDVTSYRGKVTL